MSLLGSTLAASEAAEAQRFASFDVPSLLWVGFVALIALLLIADLLLVHRTAHVITFKEAAIESSRGSRSPSLTAARAGD